MTVAVVIPTRDRPDRLAAALAAIEADEVVVVDSASKDRDEVARVAQARGARVVRCDEPGAACARNAGVRATTAPIVAFTDDDCRPQPGWVAAIEAAFTDDVGVVAGRVTAEGGGAFVLSVTAESAPSTFRAGDDPIGVAHGANLAVRRDAFEQVGGFDELLGPGSRFPNGEDYDLFWRILAAGWTGRFAQDAVVVHEQWRGRLASLGAYYRYGVGDGAFAMKADRRLLVDRLWRRGLRQVGADLRRGNESAALADLAKAAGVAVGAARARRIPVRDGHFVA